MLIYCERSRYGYNLVLDESVVGGELDVAEFVIDVRVYSDFIIELISNIQLSVFYIIVHICSTF